MPIRPYIAQRISIAKRSFLEYKRKKKEKSFITRAKAKLYIKVKEINN